MKRPRAPVALIRSSPPSIEAVGRGVLFVHLLLTPLLFSQATVEGFEFLKFLGLVLTALLLLVLGILVLPRISIDDARCELRQPLTTAGLAFVGSALLSTLTSISPNTSLYGHHENFAGSITIMSYFILFIAARRLVHTPEQMRMMLVAVAMATAGITIYGFLQVCRLDPLEWRNRSTIGHWERPFSTFGHANFLGAYLVLALPLLVWLSVRVSHFNRAILLTLTIAVLTLTLLSLSRGAWLGIACAFGIAAVGLWRSQLVGSQNVGRSLRDRNAHRGATRLLVIVRRHWVLAAATGCGLVAITLLSASDELTYAISRRTSHFLNGSGRFEIWATSWPIFLEQPLAGCGPDTFHQAFGRHGGITYWKIAWGETPARAHNEVLHILATQGVIGLVAIFAGLATLGLTLRRAWKRQETDRGLLVAIAAALVGFLVTELVGFTVIACGSLAVVLLAIVSRLGESADVTVTKPAVSSPPPIWRLGQAIAIACCLVMIQLLVVDPLRADLVSSEAECFATSQPERALRLYERAVQLCPREPIYWSRLAVFTENAARDADDRDDKCRMLERAHAGYAAAVERDREDAYHFAGLGRTLGELARIGKAKREDAFAAFDRAMKLDPANPSTYADASRAALLVGDAARAQAYASAGMTLYPDFGPLREQIVMRHLLLNQPVEAIIAFDAAFKADWSRNVEDLKKLIGIYKEFERRLHAKSPGSPGGAGAPRQAGGVVNHTSVRNGS